MFNFFSELKSKIGDANIDLYNEFNIINVSGKLLYVEGHNGLTILSPTTIAFKIKRGRVVVDGENMFLKELTDNTLMIQGKISKTEIF